MSVGLIEELQLYLTVLNESDALERVLEDNLRVRDE